MRGINDKCDICGFFIVEKHHILPGKKDKDWKTKTIPLCPNHHGFIHLILDGVRFLPLKKDWLMVVGDKAFSNFLFDVYIPEFEKEIKTKMGKQQDGYFRLRYMLENLKGGKE